MAQTARVCGNSTHGVFHLHDCRCAIRIGPDSLGCSSTVQYVSIPLCSSICDSTLGTKLLPEYNCLSAAPAPPQFVRLIRAVTVSRHNCHHRVTHKTRSPTWLKRLRMTPAVCISRQKKQNNNRKTENSSHSPPLSTIPAQPNTKTLSFYIPKHANSCLHSRGASKRARTAAFLPFSNWERGFQMPTGVGGDKAPHRGTQSCTGSIR